MNKPAIRDAINIADLARLAKARLPGVIFDFLEGGAEEESTLRDNRAAFDRYRLRPAMLTGHAERDLSITLFGHRLSAPFLIGPTGLNGIYWVDADLALARATLFGVAAGGQQGAAKALAILRDETDRVMTLMGCASAAELTPDRIMRI